MLFQEALLLVQRAKRLYRAQSSNTVRDRLISVTSRHMSVDSAEYVSLTQQPCLTVSADEIVSHCYSHYQKHTSLHKPSTIKVSHLDGRDGWMAARSHDACHVSPFRSLVLVM